MKKLFLLLVLCLFSAQGFANLCPDGSRPTRTISDDGSYFEYKCAGTTKTSKQSNSTVSTYPLAIQPDSLDVFCDKVNADCSDAESQKWYRAYYTLPANKAMAIAYPKGRILGGISGAFFWYGEATPNRAKAQALSQCNITKAVYSDKCYILLDNHLIVNQDYIKLLNKKTSTQSSSYSSSTKNSSSIKIPFNATRYSNTIGWKCNNGYFKSGNKCKPLPSNAYSVGSSCYANCWDCKGGYEKHNNGCRKLSDTYTYNAETEKYELNSTKENASDPENAYSLSDELPKNSHKSGAGWECNSGFSQYGNKCIAKSSSQNESTSYLEEIKKAKKLLDDGVITEDEFTAIKKKIIDDI